MKITLNWPDPRLSPNASSKLPGWEKTAAKNAAKWEVTARVKQVGVKRPSLRAEGPIPVRVTFFPPALNRKRDQDNMLASMKAHFDALSKALGVDDSRFEYTLARGLPEGPGKVTVEINDAD